MGTFISKGKAIHPKFQPPGSPPGLLRTATPHSLLPRARHFTRSVPCNLTTSQRAEDAQFTDEETKTQRDQGACPKSQLDEVDELFTAQWPG